MNFENIFSLISMGVCVYFFDFTLLYSTGIYGALATSPRPEPSAAFAAPSFGRS